jgi:hypothetical protein
MPKQVAKLTARTIATITAPGRHSDGGGLYLYVGPIGARSWLFMWKVGGKRREMGLMGLGPVRNPIRSASGMRRKRSRAKTFGAAAYALLDDVGQGWRNDKHRASPVLCQGEGLEDRRQSGAVARASGAFAAKAP